jgi:hypothetical protein
MNDDRDRELNTKEKVSNKNIETLFKNSAKFNERSMFLIIGEYPKARNTVSFILSKFS